MIQPSTVDCLQRLQSRSSDASPTGLPNVVSRDRAQGLRAQGLVQAEAIEAGELLKLQRWQRRQQLAAGVTPLFDQPPPKFEQLTPMLVMPFTQFKAQGRIMKSTKVWRDEALATGALVMWWEQKGGDKIVIFISHTWWDRGVKDETRADVPVRLLWPHGGKTAYICGSFTQWQKMRMQWRQAGASGEWFTYFDLTPGTHQYNFIIDGQWRHDHTAPTVLDKFGNVNNCTHVQLPAGSGAGPDDKHDRGAPDYQTGEKQNLKWRVTCAGVRRLARKHRLKEEDISLWIDWQSICQDDEEEKLKGVKSLLRYASLCQYMLIPTEEMKLKAYGSRGWCRIEYFVFSRLAEMRGHAVRLYAIQLDGTLNHFPDVDVDGFEFMPSRGAFSRPEDRELITSLADKMIEAHGNTLVEVKCKEAWCLRGPAGVPAGPGGHVDLEAKMIRQVHMDALFKSMDCYHIASLDLSCNQLGLVGFREKYHVEGHQMPTFSSVYAIPTFSFKLNATLTSLNLGWNGLGPKGTAQLAAGLKGNTTLTSLILDGNCLCGVYKEFNNKTQFLEEMGTYSAAAFTELCEALKYSAVTSLSLYRNDIYDRGVESLAAVLKNTKITRLNISNNELGPRSGAMLAESIGWRFGRRLSSIVTSLKGFSFLASLDISFNHLDEKAKRALAKAFRGQSSQLQL